MKSSEIQEHGKTKTQVFLLGFLFFLFCSEFAQSDSIFWKGPFFWDEKPEISKRMRTERYIPVSVISKDDKGSVIWWMKGAGRVEAPAEYVFNYARDMKKLAQQKEHFEDIQWKAESSELFFKLKALGKSIKFRLKIWETKTTGEFILHFHFSEGPLSGSEGVVIVKEVARQEAQVSLVLYHEGDLFSFGNFIMSIAVEGVLHHMAESLRSSVEQAWKTEK